MHSKEDHALYKIMHQNAKYVETVYSHQYVMMK